MPCAAATPVACWGTRSCNEQIPHRAWLEQLDTRDGVGPATAQKLRDWRCEHGGFRSVDRPELTCNDAECRGGPLGGLSEPTKARGPALPRVAAQPERAGDDPKAVDPSWRERLRLENPQR